MRHRSQREGVLGQRRAKACKPYMGLAFALTCDARWRAAEFAGLLKRITAAAPVPGSRTILVTFKPITKRAKSAALDANGGGLRAIQLTGAST